MAWLAEVGAEHLSISLPYTERRLEFLFVESFIAVLEDSGCSQIEQIICQRQGLVYLFIFKS